MGEYATFLTFRLRIPRKVYGSRLKRCTAVAGLFAVSSVTPAHAGGSLTVHMASHIVLMNVLAPIVAIIIIAWIPLLVRNSGKAMLTGATVTQIAVLWTAHTPVLLAFAASTSFSHTVVQAVLFLVALWFWMAVFIQPPREFWRAIFALLITGKLFCLLGALLVFAPRALYHFPQGTHSAVEFASAVATDDQHLAGLLMLLACPMSYVLAGIVIATRALRALDSQEGFHVFPATDRGGRLNR